MQEEFGYTFILGNPYKVGFYWYGGKDTGKSTLQAILRGLLGAENVASVPLQDFGKIRFASQQLDGRYANLFPDLPDQSLRSVGVLKMLLGNVDLMNVEQKFRDAYHIVNRCKLFFSSNVFPRVEAEDEDADAFYRRWILTTFRVEIPLAEQDPGLADRLVETEGPAILNWALEGLRRLLARGRFSDSPTAGSIADTWKNKSDSLRWYLSAARVPREGSCTKADFYADYAEWCNDQGVAPQDLGTVTRRMPKLLPGTKLVRSGPRGHRTFTWHGVSLPAPPDQGAEEGDS